MVAVLARRGISRRHRLLHRRHERPLHGGGAQHQHRHGEHRRNVGYAIGTGNTTNGFSGATIDQSTLNTTNTLPFRVVAPVTTSGNFGQIGNGSDPSTAYGWAVVAFNSQNFKQLTGLA